MDFETFWKAYPGRRGMKRCKALASRQFNSLSAIDQEQATEAAVIYAGSSDARSGFAKDAFRWLRDRLFEDWLDPTCKDDGVVEKTDYSVEKELARSRFFRARRDLMSPGDIDEAWEAEGK